MKGTILNHSIHGNQPGGALGDNTFHLTDRCSDSSAPCFNLAATCVQYANLGSVLPNKVGVTRRDDHAVRPRVEQPALHPLRAHFMPRQPRYQNAFGANDSHGTNPMRGAVTG